VSLKGTLLADLRQERAMTNQQRHYKMVKDSLYTVLLSELESFKEVLVAKAKALNQLRHKRHRGNSPIKNELQKLLVTLGSTEQLIMEAT
jgi:MarR-like DNA-binding transcriptional regulator SgrR of sgrS sRNA